MKKFACLVLSFLAVLSSFTVSYAVTHDTKFWQEEYLNIINITKVSEDTRFVLVDTDYDEIPELFLGNGNKVTAYSFKNGAVCTLYETHSVPIEYFENIKACYNTSSSITEFLGQSVSFNKKNEPTITTYRLTFSENGISSDIIASEKSDGSGVFQGTPVSDCHEKVSSFFECYSLSPLTVSCLGQSEIDAAEKKEDAASSFTNRHTFLNALSDDTADFSTAQREEIKKIVGDKPFLRFEKISKFGSSNIFVQFYVARKDGVKTHLPQEKAYACLSENSGTEPVLFFHESEIDTGLLSQLHSAEYVASNVFIDYIKTSGFRSFDEHMSYLNNLLSESSSKANVNGKKTILEYVEYAVNKTSRTQIKSKNNVFTVNRYSVSFISEFAVSSMEKMLSVCESSDISTDFVPGIIPELVCTDFDLSKPIRVEFEKGVATSLAGTSGLRIMLDDVHGIFVSTENLTLLESAYDSFCVEIKHTPGCILVVFADRSNNIIKKLKAPVSFILPAANEFSSVLATFESGTETYGGEYSEQNKTIEFSADSSAKYEVIDKDITINDISNLPEETQKAIRFLGAKDILSLENNEFKPDDTITNYEFTKAIISLFYDINPKATLSFEDVPEDSEFYSYVASAEDLELTVATSDGKFGGENDVIREVAVAFCGKTLAKKGGFKYPEKASQHITFSDKNRISEWAKDDIALAVAEGLLEPVKRFSPRAGLKKIEAAELLYKTYMKLYKPASITTMSEIKLSAPNNGENEFVDWEFRAAMLILSSIIILFIGYVIRKIIKRRKRLSAINKESFSSKENDGEQD